MDLSTVPVLPPVNGAHVRAAVATAREANAQRQRLTTACVVYALFRPAARGLIIEPTPDGKGWRFYSMGAKG